jgi:hypothetical protein
MTQTAPAAGRRAGGARPRDVLAVGAGLVTGGFAAWASYTDPVRPLAHTFLLWTALLVLTSAGAPARRAVVRAVLALATAVPAFYVGKQVVHGVRHPGMPYALNASELVEWLALAVVAGTLLGWVFCRVGRPGPAGALAAAAAIGLLVADAYRRSAGRPDEGAVVWTVAVLAAVAVLVLDVRSWRRLALVGVLVVPCALAGYLLVSAPDALEQLLLTGGF